MTSPLLNFSPQVKCWIHWPPAHHVVQVFESDQKLCGTNLPLFTLRELKHLKECKTVVELPELLRRRTDSSQELWGEQRGRTLPHLLFLLT